MSMSEFVKNSVPYIFAAAAIALVLMVFFVGSTPLILPSGDTVLEPGDITLLQIDAPRLLFLIVIGYFVFFGMHRIHRRIVSIEKNLLGFREVHIADRFNSAITQLGTYKLEVQLGGIFSLERIAFESSEDHWPIMEILTAYIRENAKWQGESSTATVAITPNGNTNGKRSGSARASKVSTDIQAVLTILGRRKWIDIEAEEMKVLNLRWVNLASSDLRRGYFEYANFRGSNLERCNFTEAKLANAFLAETDLRGVNFLKADLQGANLVGANLENANLKDADLSGANLYRARLGGAHLSDANLRGANLTQVNMAGSNVCGVSLVNVNLTNTRLNQVKFDYETVFPDWLSPDMKAELGMVFQH